MLEESNIDYSLMLSYWDKMNDLYAGSKVVKSKGEKYLPPSAGMVLDGVDIYNSTGWRAYQRYKQRAEYINHVKDAVDTYVGLCHQQSPTIQLPKAMEYLRESATKDGQSLEGLLRKINTEQVKLGRCGLLVDIDTSPSGDSKPFIAFYDAESIINWNDSDNKFGMTSVSMLVLKESVRVLNNFSWNIEDRYRVCLLGDGSEVSVGDKYKQGVFLSGTYDYDKMFTPSYLGTTLDFIPFVFINTCNCLSVIDYPPLDDLAEQSISAYCLSADYKQALHMQGQDTLVIKGNVINAEDNNTDPSNPRQTAEQSGIRTGAGAVINVSSDGSAEFIGVNGDGIPEMRQALENAYSRCESKAGKLIARGESIESGESLKTRLTAQTATLNQIALTGAFALQKALRNIALWLGLDQNEVVVKPNLEFSDFRNNGDDLVKLMSSKALGLPMSYESIYSYAMQKGYVNIPFKTQLELIKKEKKSELDKVLLPANSEQLSNSNSGLNPLNGVNSNKIETTTKEVSDVTKVNGETNA